MIIFKIVVIVSVFAIIILAAYRLFRYFNQRIIAPYVLAPVIMFCLGYGLRFSENKDLIDMGYFLTDISSMLIFLFLAAASFLGQLKYYKE